MRRRCEEAKSDLDCMEWPREAREEVLETENRVYIVFGFVFIGVMQSTGKCN